MLLGVAWPVCESESENVYARERERERERERSERETERERERERNIKTLNYPTIHALSDTRASACGT